MAKTLSQIVKELDPSYAPSRNTIQGQIKGLPGQTATQLEGLQATADQSRQDILNQARSRGLGFSGIPIAEQTKYDATTYKPAVANLYAQQNQAQTSLQEALNTLNREQRTTAQGLRQQYLDRDLQKSQLLEQRRQFNENLAFQREQARQQAAATAAAASAGLGAYLSGGGGSGSDKPANVPQAVQRGDKGYNFTDARGNPISAAAFSKLTGTPFRTLLEQMARSGDAGAKRALGFVGNDYGYNPLKVGQNKSVISLLNNLLWGVGSVGSYSVPKQRPVQAPSTKLGIGTF